MKHTYNISGMSCDGCRTNVEKALNSIDGVEVEYVSMIHSTLATLRSVLVEKFPELE